MDTLLKWTLALLLCYLSSNNKINLHLFTDMERLPELKGVTIITKNLEKTVQGNNVKMFGLTSNIELEYFRKSSYQILWGYERPPRGCTKFTYASPRISFLSVCGITRRNSAVGIRRRPLDWLSAETDPNCFCALCEYRWGVLVFASFLKWRPQCQKKCE